MPSAAPLPRGGDISRPAAIERDVIGAAARLRRPPPQASRPVCKAAHTVSHLGNSSCPPPQALRRVVVVIRAVGCPHLPQKAATSVCACSVSRRIRPKARRQVSAVAPVKAPHKNAPSLSRSRREMFLPRARGRPFYGAQLAQWNPSLSFMFLSFLCAPIRPGVFDNYNIFSFRCQFPPANKTRIPLSIGRKARFFCYPMSAPSVAFGRKGGAWDKSRRVEKSRSISSAPMLPPWGFYVSMRPRTCVHPLFQSESACSSCSLHTSTLQ